MGKIYELRSAVEHLHDPLSCIDGATQSEKVTALFRKSYEVEALARYCLQRFLTRHGLWLHFQDDSTLQQFWQKDKSERENLWGDKLDISQVSKGFRPDLIRPEFLRLP